MFEIERKFLTVGQIPFAEAVTIQKITQGFMSTDPNKVIRVRLLEDLTGEHDFAAYLTVKGKNDGCKRVEIETLIEFGAASELLARFCRDYKIIEKIRYTIPHDDLFWEVDVFRTDNKGLIIAEVELNSEDQEINLPTWVAGEITNDHRYSNASLAQRPWPFEGGKL